MKRYDFALIKFDSNSSETEIVSTHITEEGADRALAKVDGRTHYVAKKRADGEYETRLQARDRAERAH